MEHQDVDKLLLHRIEYMRGKFVPSVKKYLTNKADEQPLTKAKLKCVVTSLYEQCGLKLNRLYSKEFSGIPLEHVIAPVDASKLDELKALKQQTVELNQNVGEVKEKLNDDISQIDQVEENNNQDSKVIASHILDVQDPKVSGALKRVFSEMDCEQRILDKVSQRLPLIEEEKKQALNYLVSLEAQIREEAEFRERKKPNKLSMQTRSVSPSRRRIYANEQDSI